VVTFIAVDKMRVGLLIECRWRKKLKRFKTR